VDSPKKKLEYVPKDKTAEKEKSVEKKKLVYVPKAKPQSFEKERVQDFNPQYPL